MASSGTETEVKIAIVNGDAIAQRLRDTGLAVTKPRVFEANTLYDDPAQSLRNRGCILRLRQVGDRTILTFKGPAERSKHKSREELETTMGDPAVAAAIFERLSYAPVFRYEKYRTEYERVGETGVVTVDETPIGWYLELEGPAEWIDRTAVELGFSDSDYILLSYGALFAEYRERTRSESPHMTFSS